MNLEKICGVMSQVCRVVSIYLQKYLVTLSMLIIALTPSILWSDHHCKSRFRSLYKEPGFSELEIRLVVGTNSLFRTPRANQMARNLAQ